MQTDNSSNNGNAGGVDPALMEFLEAEELGEKLEVLRRVQDSLSDRSLTSIEMSLGMEPQKDSAEERVQRIRNLLQTRRKYETGKRY